MFNLVSFTCTPDLGTTTCTYKTVSHPTPPILPILPTRLQTQKPVSLLPNPLVLKFHPSPSPAISTDATSKLLESPLPPGLRPELGNTASTTCNRRMWESPNPYPPLYQQPYIPTHPGQNSKHISPLKYYEW